MEPYFRDMTLQDLEMAEPKPLSSSNWLDPCLLVPFVGSGKEVLRRHVDPSDVAVVAENSSSNSIEVENGMVHSKHDPHESSDFVWNSAELVNSNGASRDHCERDMQEVILHQDEQPVVIELDPGKRDGVVLPGLSQNPDSSLSWLLGARGRAVLTSERPNKKRKLLGADAGLEQLVVLPPLEGDSCSKCDVCCLGESDAASNRMLQCNRCKVSVHQKCYGVQVEPDGYWMCALCERRLTQSDAGRIAFMPCVLCSTEKGALKPVKCEPGGIANGGNLNFAHLFCSLWSPEVFVEDMDSMEPITNIEDIPEKRTKMVCTICKIMRGACVRCSHGTCRACFHPICAREKKHQMEIWGKSGLKNVRLFLLVELRIFCSKHSRVRGISSVHHVNGFAEQDTAQVGLDDENFAQIRSKRKSKDKFMNFTSMSSSLSSQNKAQTTELVTSTCAVRATESQQVQCTNMVVDQPTGAGNLVSSSGDVSTFLRKLIDQGKVSVGDIQSELGLSSESLEAALVPETSTFSPGLKLKIIKLLQNSIHVPSVQVKSLKEGSVAPEGPLDRSEIKNVTDSQLGSELEEGISSFDHCFPDGDKANKDTDSVENCVHTCHDGALMVMTTIFIHLLRQCCRICATIFRIKINRLNIIMFSLYLAEDLMPKVVQSLPQEMDSSNKRKWDHIIVNQFLRDIREAKKRGNTERRHKEAQAILAATAPIAAPTSKDVNIRKETENDAVPVKQESITKVHAGSLRISQLTSLPQTKDPSFSNSKVSADTNFGIFDLAKFSKKNGLPCDVCMRRETVLNRVFLCSSCKAAVHLDCYQSRTNPTGPWKCERCQEMLSDAVVSDSQSDCSGSKSWLVQCGLCHGTSGSLRKTTNGQWVHAFCAEWLLENSFKRGQCNPVDGMCSTVGCQVTFHPACARDAGLYMNTKKFGSLWQHKAYCSNHSIEQKKVDSQQYGPAEVKIMKQMRVELERLRLLCERVVKREKEKVIWYISFGCETFRNGEFRNNIRFWVVNFKKELLVCEHDILAVKRDYVAFSMRASCYTPAPGASSESATTSVNNNSYGGKRQRSDDITMRSDDVTVDSTIPRKHTIRFPVHSKDTDRNTADSSTSTISYKRKLDDVESLALKNLQERAATAMQKSEDGETKSTDNAMQKSEDGETKSTDNALQKSEDGETKSTDNALQKSEDGETKSTDNALQKSEDGETKSADKKHEETAKKEPAITSDQAVSQKQHPPKRLVYTRRGSSKKKQRNQDVVVQGPVGG
ncbi:PHD finger protein rhinoceros [Triticum urartu]|uniref:PHD finger protein rhinoceros n=1 Tax=Triticum urartu TaxID=4572 RepID=M8A0J9_TRIUA|nr:PHD finger protein rhinoceros [Triticum urartu]